jgi:hypothetical protein
MLIEARTAFGANVVCQDMAGNHISSVFAVDTTEGWIDIYILRPNNVDGLCSVFVDRKNREFAKVRLHTDFDIFTKNGRKLFQVRWTLDGEARPVETQFGELPV